MRVWRSDQRRELPQPRVQHSLVPELSSGDTVVMDNLAAHKVAGVKDAIRATGASVLYLPPPLPFRVLRTRNLRAAPPYSPDLNPIEQMFAKLKALLRKARTRTRDALWSTIGHLLDEFSPAECDNYIKNSGYDFA